MIFLKLNVGTLCIISWVDKRHSPVYINLLYEDLIKKIKLILEQEAHLVVHALLILKEVQWYVVSEKKNLFIHIPMFRPVQFTIFHLEFLINTKKNHKHLVKNHQQMIIPDKFDF